MKLARPRFLEGLVFQISINLLLLASIFHIYECASEGASLPISMLKTKNHPTSKGTKGCEAIKGRSETGRIRGGGERRGFPSGCGASLPRRAEGATPRVRSADKKSTTGVGIFQRSLQQRSELKNYSTADPGRARVRVPAGASGPDAWRRVPALFRTFIPGFR